jgi:hypothetical protein
MRNSLQDFKSKEFGADPRAKRLFEIGSAQPNIQGAQLNKGFTIKTRRRFTSCIGIPI